MLERDWIVQLNRLIEANTVLYEYARCLAKYLCESLEVNWRPLSVTICEGKS